MIRIICFESVLGDYLGLIILHASVIMHNHGEVALVGRSDLRNQTSIRPCSTIDFLQCYMSRVMGVLEMNHGMKELK